MFAVRELRNHPTYNYEYEFVKAPVKKTKSLAQQSFFAEYVIESIVNLRVEVSRFCFQKSNKENHLPQKSGLAGSGQGLYDVILCYNVEVAAVVFGQNSTVLFVD